MAYGKAVHSAKEAKEFCMVQGKDVVAKAVLMANLSSYDSDVLSEVPNSETYQTDDMINQSVLEMQYSKETPIDDYPDNEITIVQDTNSSTPQDVMIVSMFKQITNQVTNLDKVYKENNIVIESLTAEHEKYKERVKTFEQRLSIDLSSREKFIDSQMDDMIRNRHELKQEIDSLKQNLSKHIKEKESLLQTFTVFKKESKEKENKYMDKEIDFEKKIKELDNIIYKVGQSAQTKSQQIKPTLYDGIVISKKQDVVSVDDSDETLILEEGSRSKMIAKQNDTISKEKKINISLINYPELNKLAEDFGKHFVPQQEQYAKQAFWLPISNSIFEQPIVQTTPVRTEAPCELPKVDPLNPLPPASESEPDNEIEVENPIGA
ncbi:hypothetical protein Tco_1473503 [Tanacetum coccineum]